MGICGKVLVMDTHTHRHDNTCRSSLYEKKSEATLCQTQLVPAGLAMVPLTAKMETISKVYGAFVKTYLAKSKKITTGQAEKEGKKRTYAGAVRYFMKELWPMENPQRTHARAVFLTGLSPLEETMLKQTFLTGTDL